MPIDYSGEEGWNSALKTLSSGLFPDPSKGAQAYYYGAQARHSQLESNKLTGQQNIVNRLLQTTQPGVMPPAPLHFTQPPLTGAAPIPASPANLPMSSIIAPGGAMPTPAQAVSALPTAMAPLMQGTPPPVSSPSAFSPPAPNTTGSDGSVPGNDPVAGAVHPGSVTPPDGGPKMSGPAASNGSPAPLPPNMNPQGMSTLAAAAGFDPAMAALFGQQAVGEAFRTGRFDAHNAHEMLATTGQPAPVVADIGAAASRYGHELGLKGTLGAANIQAGAAIRGHEITQAGENYRAGQTPMQVLGPDGVMTNLPRTQGFGKPGYDSGLAVKREEQGGAPVQVQPGGPGTAIYSERTDVAQKGRSRVLGGASEQARATAQEAVGTYFDRKDPSKPITTTAGDAIARDLMPAPDTMDKHQAALAQAYAASIGDQERQKQILDAMKRTATTPRAATTAEEDFKRRKNNYEALQEASPQPDPNRIEIKTKAPVALEDDAQAYVDDRATQLERTDPRFQGEPGRAWREAYRQAQSEGAIPTDTEINELRTRDVRLWGRDARLKDYKPPGAPAVTSHLMIGLKNKPATAAGGGGGGGGAPAGANYLGDAPPGTPDGPNKMKGKPVVVRGGKVYDK